MRLSLRDHLRHNLVGYLALFVALGGTSYAAATLEANSVRSRHIAPRNVTISDLAAMPGAKARLEQSQPIPHQTTTRVVFGTEEFDVGAMFDPATPDRIRIKKAGVYLLVGYGIWQSTPGGNERQINIITHKQDGAFDDLVAGARIAPTGTWTVQQNVSGVARLGAGQFVTLTTYHNQGATLDLLGADLTAYRLGR